MRAYRQEMAAKCVKMCRNGDSFFPPVNVVVNPRDIRNMDAFLDRVTQVTRMRNAARKVCTPRRGHRIEDLNKLIPGEMYVAVGQEGFKTLNYGDIHVRKPALPRRELKIEPVKHSRILMSARCRKVALWESSGLKSIYVYRNGDDKNPSHKVLLDRRTLLNMDKVLEFITERVKLESGAVLRLFTLHAKEILTTAELVNGERYVAVGHGKKFKRTAYNDNQKVSPNNSPRRPKVKHRVFMQRRGHLSPTGGEITTERRIFAERESGSELQERPTISKEFSRTVPQNTTIKATYRDDVNRYGKIAKKDEKSKPNRPRTDESLESEQPGVHLGKTIAVLEPAEHKLPVVNSLPEPSEHRPMVNSLPDDEVDLDDVYKASGAGSEQAKAVEDDRDINVEKPIDQVAAEEVVEDLAGVEPEDAGESSGQSEQKVPVEPSATDTIENENVEKDTAG